MAVSNLLTRISFLSFPTYRLRLHSHARSFASIKPPTSIFAPLDAFPERHIGPDDREASKMLKHLGYDNMDDFVGETVPSKIRLLGTSVDNDSIPALSESELHARAKELGARNKPFKSYIGMGYHNAVVPPVILRNVSTFFFLFTCFST
jgi:glycine dehydrogenase